MKRAKAKQRRQEEESSSSQQKNHLILSSSSSLNPLDSIRSDMVQLGYDLVDVDKAMDEMWTKQLDYSDVNAVLTYLQEFKIHDAEEGERQRPEDMDMEHINLDLDSNPTMVSKSKSDASPTPTETSSAADTATVRVTVCPSPIITSKGTPVTEDGVEEEVLHDRGHSQEQDLDVDLDVDALADQACPASQGVEVKPSRSSCPESQKAQINPTGATGTTITITTTTALTDDDHATEPLHNSSSDMHNHSSMSAQPIPRKIKKPKPRGEPLSLSAKLDIVAQSQDLTDGIIALTEWVVKAASPPQIIQLCENTSSNNNTQDCTNNNIDRDCALKTVIRRIIHSGDGKYTGQLLDLIGTILRSVDAPSTQLVSCAKALGMLLKRATEACSVSITSTKVKEGIANSVADHASKIVKSVVKSMIHDACKPTSTFASNKSLETEMHQLLHHPSNKLTPTNASSPRSASTAGVVSTSKKSVVDLMANRDKSKAISEKYARLVETSIQEASSIQESSSEDNLSQPLDESHVIQDLLGDEYTNVVMSKVKIVELNARQDQLKSSNPVRVGLAEHAHSYKQEKDRIATRLEQLRAELSQLEREEVEVNEKIEETEAKLVELEGSCSEEEKALREELEVVSGKMELDACVSLVAKQVCEFDAVMKTVSNAVQGTKSGGEGGEEASVMRKGDSPVDAASSVNHALASYLKVTKFYFTSELNVVRFLQDRTKKIEAEIPTMVSAMCSHIDNNMHLIS